LARSETSGPSRRERPAAVPPLWGEGDGAPSTRRTARRPRRGSIAPPGHYWVLPTSGFLIATACLTVSSQACRSPISARARARSGSETAVGARPEGALRTTATARGTQHTGLAT